MKAQSYLISPCKCCGLLCIHGDIARLIEQHRLSNVVEQLNADSRPVSQRLHSCLMHILQHTEYIHYMYLQPTAEYPNDEAKLSCSSTNLNQIVVTNNFISNLLAVFQREPSC